MTPDVAIRGDGVSLTTFTEANIDSSYLGWLNDRWLMRHSRQSDLVHTRESATMYWRDVVASEGMMFSVWDDALSRQIGTVVVTRDPRNGIDDIGILIGDAESRGRGRGLEAWRLAMTWSHATDGARKITGGALVENTAMLRIMERSGMVRECVRRSHVVVGGVARDVAYYAWLGSRRHSP